jgi:hypothetical protein
MDSRRKFGLFCISALLVILAVGCNPLGSTPSSLAGFWADPDNNVSTIEDQGGSSQLAGEYFAVVSVYDLNQAQSPNLLVTSNFWNRMLTWRYCPTAKPCLTVIASAFHGGDTLNVNWQNEKGEEGKMALKRVAKGTP